MGVLGGSVAALLGGCGLFGGNSYRFKMTVEVETPEGLRTGSSVYEVKGIGSRDLITGGKGSRTTLRGEAVAVDLPGGKALFALLRMANGTSTDDHLGIMSMRLMDPAMINTEKDKSARRIASGDSIRSPADVPLSDYPLLVMFADINDPTSVTRVDPANLAASLGAGMRLKRIVVEVTDEDVTVAIGKRLAWLSSQKTVFIPPTKRYLSEVDKIETVGPNDFDTELFK